MSIRDVYRGMASVFQVDREQLIADVRRTHPEFEESESSPRHFKIVPVRSYVASMKTLGSGTVPGVMVPPFATHWGVAVEDTLYHLTFRDRDDDRIELSDFARHGRPIRFTCTLCDPGAFDDYPIVGQSRADHEARVKIGRALIEAFGSYHRLFWNCQTFAQCYVYFITGGNSFCE
jgi:hypothetical protein